MDGDPPEAEQTRIRYRKGKKMRLRALKAEDAPLMLEWMHDPEVVRDMQTDFSQKTLQDCEVFIRAAADSRDDIHFAITTDTEDEYLGTVSLKQFAITIRKCAMGTGASGEAMRAILTYGLDDLGLDRIYWCVSPDNRRAVRFYDKNGYRRVRAPDSATGYTPEQRERYYWYAVTRECR